MAGSEYYLQHPKDQRFFKVIAILSTLTGLGIMVEWYYDVKVPWIVRVYYKFIMLMTHIAAPIMFLSQVLYFYLNYSTMSSNTSGTVLVIAPVTILAWLNMLSSKLGDNIRVMKGFMTKYHLCNFEDEESVNNEHIKQIRVKTEIFTRASSFFLIFFLLSDWAAWSFITMYNNYRWNDLIKNETMIYQTIFYMVWPMDYRYNLTNWAIVHTCNIIALMLGCAVILLHNCMNFAFVFQLIGHIKILKYKLQTYFVGDLSDDDVKLKLIEVIKYHSVVMSLFSDIQSAFGVNITAMYAYNLLADSVLLYEILVDDNSNKMMYSMMVVVYLGGLSVLSFVLEEIRRQSDDLPDMVYDINWEGMSISNRKMVQLLLLRNQPLLVYTSAGGLQCGVKPLISIIQSTFSYYVMLSESKAEE